MAPSDDSYLVVDPQLLATIAMTGTSAAAESRRAITQRR
jgi:hypothetical protein